MWIAADAPTSADWLAAWGQVGGAVATTAAVVVALWLAARDQRWRRADQTARDAAQARLVTVEIDYNIDSSPVKITAVITNSSQSPILDVAIDKVRNLKQPDLQWRFRTDLPGERAYAWALRTGQTLESLIEFYETAEPTQSVVPDFFNELTVSYTDTNGHRWQRTNNWEPEKKHIRTRSLEHHRRRMHFRLDRRKSS